MAQAAGKKNEGGGGENIQFRPVFGGSTTNTPRSACTRSRGGKGKGGTLLLPQRRKKARLRPLLESNPAILEKKGERGKEIIRSRLCVWRKKRGADLLGTISLVFFPSDKKKRRKDSAVARKKKAKKSPGMGFLNERRRSGITKKSWTEGRALARVPEGEEDLTTTPFYFSRPWKGERKRYRGAAFLQHPATGEVMEGRGSRRFVSICNLSLAAAR